MLVSGRRLRGAFNGTFFLALVVVGSSFSSGCKRKAPADRELQEGYRLLQTDPKAALAQLEKAQNPTDPKVVLGRGLALEKLRDYGQAEGILEAACAANAGPACWLALGRVRVALGKLDAAREAIDRVVSQDQTELSAVLLEAYLASDDPRAERALAHLQQWRKEAAPAAAAALPAEFYAAELALFRQLGRKADFDSARELLKKAKVSQPRGALSLVELAVKAGRPAIAIELLRKIEEERPPDELRRQLAQLAHGLGDHRLAGDILDTLPGSDAELVTLRAEHAFAVGDPGAAVPLRRALGVTSNPAAQANLRLMLAEVSLRSGQLKEARSAAEELLKDQANEGALLLLARIDLAEERPKAAIERLAPLTGGARGSIIARELAARAHLGLGQRTEARPLLDTILLEQPAHPRAARLRVALEVDEGKPEEGARIARDLVQRAPQDPGLRLLLADAIRKARGASAGAESLRESARAMPSNAGLWLALVRAQDDAQAPAEALAALEEAHQKLPDDVAIAATLAARLAKGGQAERAATLYRELLQRAERDPVLLNNLAVLYADELEDPAQAVTLAERAHALSREPAVVDTLGWALYRRGSPGDLGRARELLTSVASTLGSPTTRYHLGAVLLATGSASEGRLLLSQALAQLGDFPEADDARALLKAQSGR